MNFLSDFLSKYPNVPNKRRGNMAWAQRLWEFHFTDEQKKKLAKALPFFNAYVMGLPLEERKYVESPCAFLEKMQLFDCEPDEAWLPRVEVERRNHVVCGEIVEQRIYWRLNSEGKRVQSFKTMDEARGV